MRYLVFLGVCVLAATGLAGTTFQSFDLAPLKKAGAFGDAVWKDGLRQKESFDFFGIPFNLMKPENTADPSFELTLGAGDWAEAAVLFCVDEANAQALPYVTLRLTAGGTSGDATIDLRLGEGPTVAPEIGRILRGPSGTLHYPVRFARIPLHPSAVAAAAKGSPATLAFLSPEGVQSAFSIAAVTLLKRPPLEPLPEGYELSFDVDLTDAKDGDVLYEAEGALRIAVRDAKAHPAPGGYDDNGGNYLNFAAADGSCLVLEAVAPGPTGRIGVPFGVLANPRGRHHVRVVQNNAYFTIDVDTHRDEDFPIAPLLWPRGDAGAVRSTAVSGFRFTAGAAKGPVARPADWRPLSGFAAQYWTPQGHNQWVGDVVTTVWDGKLHVFYLVDRRHHNSKGGRGGHWFEHLVTDDLVRWQELPTAVPMDVPEEYVGTGTPFLLDGKYCLAYGLHTTRHCSSAEVERRGLPFGGTYSTSPDGIHFTKSHEIITRDQNPSVYNRDDGLLGMGCVDHLEKSASIHGPWTATVTNAPVRGDCPCPFVWNGWHYIIQGFCTMAKSKTGENGTWTDEVLGGYDPYDGLSVPMVAPWKDNRRLLIGWINHGYGWGGWLCLRELVQESDGCLGTKWVSEVPLPVEPMTCRVKPGEDLRIVFRKQGDRGADFAFVLDAAAKKASFAKLGPDGVPAEIPTYAELARERAAKTGLWRIHGGRYLSPYEAGDFAIGSLRGLERETEVKVVNWYDRKAGMTLVDVEIGGRRTMVTRRFGRYAAETAAK